MNLTEMKIGKVAKFSHNFDSFSSLKCKHIVKAVLQSQYCPDLEFAIDNANQVRPGSPKISHVESKAFSANIHFSRAQEMVCFSPVKKLNFPLMTELVIFQSNNTVTATAMYLRHGDSTLCSVGFFQHYVYQHE